MHIVAFSSYSSCPSFYFHRLHIKLHACYRNFSDRFTLTTFRFPPYMKVKITAIYTLKVTIMLTIYAYRGNKNISHIT